jgi:hypothetical protein
MFGPFVAFEIQNNARLRINAIKRYTIWGKSAMHGGNVK